MGPSWSVTKFNHFPQLSVGKFRVLLAQTVESGDKKQTMQPLKDFRFPGTML